MLRVTSSDLRPVTWNTCWSHLLQPWSVHITFLMLDGIWEMGASSMQVCKVRGSRWVKCFIQVHFTYLFQHIIGANAVGASQISHGEQEKKLWHVAPGLFAVRGGSWTYQVPWRHKSAWFSAFWEAQTLTCPDFHPSARASLWSPPQHCESTSSSSETRQRFAGSSAKPILEHFLKEISSSLRVKVFVANDCIFG